MMKLDELQAALLNLPIDERIHLLSVLETSVEKHLDRLAEEELRRDMAIVEQRLAELGSKAPDFVP